MTERRNGNAADTVTVRFFGSDPSGAIVPAIQPATTFERGPDGELLGRFGRFDGQDPAGFPGCCNPTNVALGPGGEVVVTDEKEELASAVNYLAELGCARGTARRRSPPPGRFHR